MSFEADLNAHLQAGSSIAALVAERIWPVLRDEGSDLPAVTTQIVSDTPSTELDDGDGYLINFRVQIDCWSRDYDQVRTLAEAVRTRMQTAASTFSATPLPGSGGENYEHETKIFRVSRDFSCWYTVP